MESHELADSPLLTSNTTGSSSWKGAHQPTTKPVQPPKSEAPSSRKALLENSTLRNGILRCWKGAWTLEICACLFAFAALGGLIAVLLAHANKPLPEWPKLVTINSIVSLFALLVRASVGFVLAEGISQSKWQWFRRPRQLADMERFDAASRGAWGSILLLRRSLYKRLSWIATIGAIITIMASLLGFFMQQLVQFQDCPQKDRTALPGISKTNNYNTSGPSIGPITHDVYPPMVVAINNGIIQPIDDYTDVLSHGCDTGNCTFPSDDGASFSTVGISHSCENVTSQIRNLTSTHSSLYTLYLNATEYGNVTLPMPNGYTLATGFTGATTHGIATVSMIYRSSMMDMNFSAVSCSIFPTVNTYGINVTRSRMREQLVGSTRLGINVLIDSPLDNLDPWVPWKLATSTTLRNGTRTPCERRDTDAPGYTIVGAANVDDAPNYTLNAGPEDTTVWYYPDDCVYSISLFSIQGIQAFLDEIFTDQKLIWGMRLGGNSGTLHLRQVYQAGNMTLATVDDMFRNITRSISVTMRTHGWEGAAGQARGVMWYQTTCMRIKWQWITYPVALIVLLAVFLVMVAIENRGVESDRLWKSSVLATLFCNVEQVVVDGIKPTGKQAMHDIARSTSVNLKSYDQTLQLVSR